MELKPGYKQTEVGVIPEEWDVQPLGRFAAITTGSKDVNEGNPAGEYPFFTCSRNHTFSDHYSFDTEAILIAGNGDVGNLHYYSGKFEAYQRTYVLSRFASDVRYIWHQLDYRLIESLGLGKIGTSIPYIKKENLTGFLFPVPPTEPEQRAIAEVLGNVDSLLGGLDRLIAKKRDLKQAAMQQLLTGQTRLPGFNSGWDSESVADLEKRKMVQLSRGKVISKKDISNTPGDFPIYSSSIHNNGLFGRYGEFMFDEELITWSVDGGGNFFHRPKHKFSVTNVCGFMRVDPSLVNCRFLAAQLQLLHSRKSFDYQSKAHPSVVRKEYVVQLPTLAEQVAIAEVLTDMDEELAALEQRRAKTRNLKQAMMQELLTGKTRLVKTNKPHA